MKNSQNSMRWHLLLPLLLLLLVQAALITAVVLYGGVSKKLKSNAIRILNENTENSRLYLEKETIHQWMGFVGDSSSVAGQIQAVLNEKGRRSSEIKTDPELNKDIVNHVIGDSINLLQRSNATGVFLVLDGPAAENSPKDTRAGFYIRGLSGEETSRNKSSLLMERGLPSLAKSLHIPLDCFWELGFDLSAEDETTDFYHKPFDAAAEHQASAMEFSNYAYLSSPFCLSPSDLQVVTYSVPVILEDGTVAGVFGMDMTVAQIQRILDTEHKDGENDETYIIARRDSSNSEFIPTIVSGRLSGSYFLDSSPVSYSNAEDDDISLMETADHTKWYASIKKLDIYNYNTPFASQEWVLVGLSRKQDLLSFYNSIRSLLLTSMLVPLVFSIVGVMVIGKLVTDPIRNLVIELRSKSGARGLALKRIHISEIDELTETIEKLSADVERSASKISTILEGVNVAIGVFEYSKETDQILCSRSLCEMLAWAVPEEPYIYVSSAEFEAGFRKSLQKKKKEGDTWLLVTVDLEARRFIRMILDRSEDGSVIGVLSDVTSDEEEKTKLEWERNYDLLTAIFNRRAFRERAESALASGAYQEAAVVMWDLDNLKYINDTYGHDEGDRYLVLFARQLRELEREGGIISRYSGDEFVTLLYAAGGVEAIRERLRLFQQRLQGCVLEIDENCSIPLRVSGGVAWYPADAGDFPMLLTYADFAMYTVKHSVKGIIMEFDKTEYKNNAYMLAGREELNRLLESGDVKFAFQPVVTRHGAIYGYELLMRPEFTNLKGIYEVLNLARAQAKLPQMERLTWTCGFKAVKEQAENGLLDSQARVFINSIASVCMTPAEEQYIEEEYGPYLSRTVIEMTESEPMSEASMNHKMMLRKRWNSLVAVDDYGAGYNGESILLAVRPDIVKVDINLIHHIDEDSNRQAIVKSLVGFARANHILVLAEGVETAKELEILIDFGIDLFQGYYIGRPTMDIRPVDSYIMDKMGRYAENREK